MAEIVTCVFRGGGLRFLETRGARDRTGERKAPQAEVSDARRGNARQRTGSTHFVKWCRRGSILSALLCKFGLHASNKGPSGEFPSVLRVPRTHGDYGNALTDSGEAPLSNGGFPHARPGLRVHVHGVGAVWVLDLRGLLR